MRMFACVGLAALLTLGGAMAQEAPKPPSPQKEHDWLKQLEGEWETECELLLEPGKPAHKNKGTETVRNLGGFWYVSEIKSECFGMPFTGLMTVGYDTQSKKYVGSWVCSMCDHQCTYKGTAEGNVITLETEAPNPLTGKLVKMKDVTEIKSKDLKVLTSSMLGEDGKWVTFMTMTSKRKK